jgi:hypothetical protein
MCWKRVLTPFCGTRQALSLVSIRNTCRSILFIKERFLSDDEIVEHLFVRVSWELLFYPHFMLSFDRKTQIPQFVGPYTNRNADGISEYAHHHFHQMFSYHSHPCRNPHPIIRMLASLSPAEHLLTRRFRLPAFNRLPVLQNLLWNQT